MLHSARTSQARAKDGAAVFLQRFQSSANQHQERPSQMRAKRGLGANEPIVDTSAAMSSPSDKGGSGYTERGRVTWTISSVWGVSSAR